MMKILVLGGTRFYGITLLKKLLSAGYEITAVSSRKPAEQILGVEYKRCRLSEIATELATKRFDFCVNNICMNRHDSIEYIDNAARLSDKHIMISSIGVYQQENSSVIPAEDSFDPCHECTADNEPYHDKREAERMLYRTLPKSSLYILRPSILVGQNDWTDRLGMYIERLLDGKGIITVQDGLNKLNLTYDFQLADVVEALISRNRLFSYPIYNVAGERCFSFREFIKYLAVLLNIQAVPLLPIKKLGINELPFLGFRDPYGKEDCVCDVSRLSAVSEAFTDFSEDIFKKIVFERAKNSRMRSPNYDKRSLEARYIEKYNQYTEYL